MVNVPDDYEEFVASIPTDKRLEVTFARHRDDRQIRGVKQSLPKKAFRQMKEQEFHEHFGHMGCGKNCTICSMARGAMRFIYVIVDKYVETRMAYMWDLDILTLNVRAVCGSKYIAVMRDRGSKFFKCFLLVFKNDFIVQFTKWLSRMREDTIYHILPWRFVEVIKTDNDGVWMRKAAEWSTVLDTFNFKMHYSDAQRKETVSHGERAIGILEVTGKSCLWQVGLPAEEWPDSFMAACWLLNRFPAVSAVSRDPVDGDVIRPLEALTMGWYSRSMINSELCKFVLPGTLVLKHDIADGSALIPKSQWAVARGMLRQQLIVYSPFTRQESKITSYTVIKGGRGEHWRDRMGVNYSSAMACKPLPGDVDSDREAILSQTFVEIAMPPILRKYVKEIRLPKSADMVRHITGKTVLEVRPPPIEELMKLAQHWTSNEQPASMKKMPQADPAKPEAIITQGPLIPTNSGQAVSRFQLPTIPMPPRAPRRESESQIVTVVEQGQEDDRDEVTPVEGPGHHLEQYDSLLPVRQRGNTRKAATEKAFVDQAKSIQRLYGWDPLAGPSTANVCTEAQVVPTDVAQPRIEAALSPEQAVRNQIPPVVKEDILLAEHGMQPVFIDLDEFHGMPTRERTGKPDQQRPTSETTIAQRQRTSTRASTKLDACIDKAVRKAKAKSVADLEHKEWAKAMSGTTVLINSDTTFVKLCKQLALSHERHVIYYEWLLRVSQGKVTQVHIGNNHQDSKFRCVIGTTVPAPHGSIWGAMIDCYKTSLRGQAAQVEDDTEYEAAKVGWAVVSAFNLYLKHEIETIDARLAKLEATGEDIMALKARVRAKDFLDGVTPPPKGVSGLYRIEDQERRSKFVAALVKELSALTDMGTVTHLHTAEELKSQFGIDIVHQPAVSTLAVFENKFPEGDTSLEKMTAKARVVVEGTKKSMQQGVHYDVTYAATPSQDSIMLFNAMVVHQKLARMSFDVGNAYCWAPQGLKLALDYPRGMAQYNDAGQRLYMCLHKNTYGKPDGANLWHSERDTFWLTHFNGAQGCTIIWTCVRLIKEQSMFKFTRTTDDTVEITYLLAWSDDCDMASTSVSMMTEIKDASHKKWTVKQVNSDFMLGVRRTLRQEEDVWKLRLTQAEFIDGLVGAYESHLTLAGWAKAVPDCPTPAGIWLSLEDPVDPKESDTVSKRGYKALVGSLLWVSRFCHKELAVGISNVCRVMSRPSERAWSHCMQMLAWLRAHRSRGIEFRSDESVHGLVATTDASNKPDVRDSRCQAGYDIHWCGGPLSAHSSKLKHAGYGSPANEYMAIRAAACTVMKFRYIFEELGLTQVIDQPTKIYCDNATAVQWVKTGKVTEGNQYIDLAYNLPRQLEGQQDIVICGIDTKDNTSDLMSKPFGPAEIKRLLAPFTGHALWEIMTPRVTPTFT